MFRSKNRMILSYLLRRWVSRLTKRGWVVRFQGHPWTLGMFILGDIWNGMGGVVSESSTWNWSKNCSGIRTCNQSPWAAKCLPGPTRVPATRPVTNVTAVSKNWKQCQGVKGEYFTLKPFTFLFVMKVAEKNGVPIQLKCRDAGWFNLKGL